MVYVAFLGAWGKWNLHPAGGGKIQKNQSAPSAELEKKRLGREGLKDFSIINQF